MKTIKLPVTLDKESKELLTTLRRQQSTVIRSSYKYSLINLSEKKIRAKLKSYNLPILDSWFIVSGVMKGKSLTKDSNNKKVIFGGKKNWYDYQEKKITKEEFKEKRLSPLCSIGQANKKGNRKFSLDIIENNSIIFKPKCGTKIKIELPKLKKNLKKELFKLEELSKAKEIPFTIELNNDNIFISYELNEVVRLKSFIKKPTVKKETRDKAKEKLSKLIKPKKSNRIIGIDQNPNYIGVSILEFNKKDKFKTIHKEVISFKKLNSKPKYKNDKKRHELIHICKYIVNLAEHFKCGKFAVEELKFDKKLPSKQLNRLCKNVWHRTLLLDQLTKRCNEADIDLIEVNACYSSFVGNLIHGGSNCPDMVASSIEVARRGYKKYTKGWFYPELKSSYLKNRWKKDLDDVDLESWIKLYNKLKELKVKYRFSLDENLEFFRNSSHKSNVNRFIFT